MNTKPSVFVKNARNSTAVRGFWAMVFAVFLVFLGVPAQSETLDEVLAKRIIDQQKVDLRHRQFVLQRIQPLELPESKQAWQKEAASIRDKVLAEVVFRGVPKEWIKSQPEVVQMGVIETKHGYRIRKMRIEALPGLWIPALLYEPDNLTSKTPVVLNVNGHAATGKSTDYKQLRCINLAKRGILALNLEWIGMGQLRTPGFTHNHLAKMDLCGVSGLSVFFLSMSRGIDVLLAHEHADPDRLAVTGLSGGGWQTIILSSLDTRVKLAVPVAGHSALAQRVAHRNSIGDLEQNPNDLASIADYVTLNALMVPRPLHLIYNKSDTCCFVASTVKSNTYEPVIPFYKQAGVPGRLSYYENSDPGTHNYEQDNREQLYAFLKKHFMPESKWPTTEIPSEEEMLEHEALNVDLPKENADFHSLAAQFAADLPLPLGGNRRDQREELRSILRFEDDVVTKRATVSVATHDGLQIRGKVLETGRGWSLPIREIVPAEKAIARTIVCLSDTGRMDKAKLFALVGNENRVLMADPVLLGQNTPTGILYQNSMLIATVGERPLAVQVAQLLAVVRDSGNTVQLQSSGPRSCLIARCAAALDGGTLIETVSTTGEVETLKEFLSPPASYAVTPEVYCFGLLQHFDVPELKALAQKGP
jgi:hypothetical protein